MKISLQEDCGYETIDICNSKAKELEERYQDLLDRKAQLKAELQKVEDEKLCLRKQEVNNVLDYVSAYQRSGVLDINDIDCYLCHCQNMLNGNIDGTFLTFTKRK